MPWGHVTVLLDKLDDQRERDWYAAAAVEYGWSRNVLLNQIMSQLQPRAGTATSNFTAQLPAADSELAQQLTRDPYVLDFLDLTGPVAERDLEKALVDRLTTSCSSSATASPSSAGSTDSTSTATSSPSTCSSSTGRSPVSSSWSWKIGRFQPEYAGQLGFYVSWGQMVQPVQKQRQWLPGPALSSARVL